MSSTCLAQMTMRGARSSSPSRASGSRRSSTRCASTLSLPSACVTVLIEVALWTHRCRCSRSCLRVRTACRHPARSLTLCLCAAYFTTDDMKWDYIGQVGAQGAVLYHTGNVRLSTFSPSRRVCTSEGLALDRGWLRLLRVWHTAAKNPGWHGHDHAWTR